MSCYCKNVKMKVYMQIKLIISKLSILNKSKTIEAWAVISAMRCLNGFLVIGSQAQHNPI